MAYIDQDAPNLVHDLLTRKEYYWLKRWPQKSTQSDIIPRFLLEDAIARSGNLKLSSYQMFVQNYINPNTNYKRLLMQWDTGTGKTIGALSIAMNFINNYRLENETGNTEIGSVFIIGFSERVFKNELLRFPEFGFLSREERSKIEKLKRLASIGSKTDIDRYHDMIIKVKKRFSNRKGNGFFKFYGYKAFVNRIFIAGKDIDLNDMSEAQIRNALAHGKISYDEELFAQFKNSLIICDEIHNVYNSIEKNNWGIAVQAVLDREPTCRAVFASATPLNNSPTEIIDLLNLLLPSDKRLIKSDFFTSDRNLKPNALAKIGELSKGRVSFLRDVNPQYYPSIETVGEELKQIPYLKFIRCPMSKYHYDTYKAVYNGALSQDSQYLIDFVLENPDATSNIGIYQTNQIKNTLANAPQKWKDKHKLDFVDGKITGDALRYDNLKKYSAKYYRMLDEIKDVIKRKKGKIFIYHNIVHMSGVLFIEQVLLKNGFLDEFGGAIDSTICICGRTRKEHHKNEIVGGRTTKESTVKPNTNHYVEPNAELDANQHTELDANQHTELDANQHTELDANQHTEPNTNQHTEPTEEPDDTPDIIEHKNKIIWVMNERDMITINKESGKYVILAGNIDNSIIEGRSHMLKMFSKLLNSLINDIISIQVPVYAPRLGEWLLHLKFKIKEQTAKYIMMQWTPSKEGGRVDPSTTNTTNKRHADTLHRFTPVRFVMAHSDIDKAQMEHSIEKFNTVDNSDGSKFMILVGSKIIKESWNIKAIQNVFIMGRPDNIPTLIQIRGRAVRKGSHVHLPEQNRVVTLKIFTSCLPEKQTTGPDKGKYKLSYEEEKYKDKILSFQTMQKIEKVLHENAIDGFINYDLINRNSAPDPLASLPFEPTVTINQFAVNELNLSTFNIYHAYKEVEVMKVLIKRLFIEISAVWEYNDLFTAVKNASNYETEINTQLFTEDHFLIALDQIAYNYNTEYVEPLINKTYTEQDINNDEIDIFGGREYSNALPDNSQTFEVTDQRVIQNFDFSTLEHTSNRDFSTPGYTSRNNYDSPDQNLELSYYFMNDESNFNDSDFMSNSAIHGGYQSADKSEFIYYYMNDETNFNNSLLIDESNDDNMRFVDGKHASNLISNLSEVKTSEYTGGSQIIDRLYDTNDKIITLPGEQNSIIVPIVDGDQQFYVLFPINHNNEPEIDIELPYRVAKQELQKTINMNNFIENKRVDFDYGDKRKIFYRKYVDISIENMENVVCEYGTTFHIKFLEECIEYVFRAWTDPKLELHDYHEFYFKMLYYYDLLSLVMWAYTSKPRIFKEYTRYAIPVRAKDIKLKTMSKYEKRKEQLEDISPVDDSDLATSGIINLLKTSLNRTSNVFIPQEFREQYEKTVAKSLELFAGTKKRAKSINKVSAELIPIGHYISKFPRLFHPDKEWVEDPTFSQIEQTFTENNVIIGFDQRSKTGVHIRFKLRNPIHTIKKHKDTRLIEKGVVCKSKSKTDLRALAAKLDVMAPEKLNVDELCVMIRSKLIRLELKERIKKSNIKWFYFHYEENKYNV